MSGARGAASAGIVESAWLTRVNKVSGTARRSKTIRKIDRGMSGFLLLAQNGVEWRECRRGGLPSFNGRRRQN
ncbi:MAG: hypothetical protein ABSD12_07200 [Paraburkholderia sp.]